MNAPKNVGHTRHLCSSYHIRSSTTQGRTKAKQAKQLQILAMISLFVKQ